MKRNILFILVLISAILSADGLDMKKFKGMKARSIGPAGMSGRVTAIDVVLSNTDVIYVGTASGGLGNPKAAASNGNPFLMIKKPLPLGT